MLPNLPVLAFLEFAINDRGASDKTLVKKGMEGMIRQLKSWKTHPDVVILGAGNRPGSDPVTGGLVDHALHCEIADYYGLAFIDIQDYLLKTLEARHRTWDDIAIVFEDGDNYHLNDYGNYLWFEAMREWFEKQWLFYDLNPSAKPSAVLPPPQTSDEFQYTRPRQPGQSQQADPPGRQMEEADYGPWYLDDLFVGRPGDKLTFTFTGKAIGTLCLVHPNGLKIEAKVDGQDVAGPFTNFPIEFGKFFMLKRGMEGRNTSLSCRWASP